MKSTGGRDCKHIPWKVRREQRGGGDGETGWSAAGGRSGARPGYGGGARERGKIYFGSPLGYNTSPYVRRRHSTGPTEHSVIGPSPSLSVCPQYTQLLPLVPSIITDAPSPSCPEVNPRNTVHPLTSSPPNHSPSIKSNSHPPLTRPRLLIPIPKIPSTALKLSRRDRIWIWSPIPLSSPLLPRRFRFPSALPLARPSAGIR